MIKKSLTLLLVCIVLTGLTGCFSTSHYVGESTVSSILAEVDTNNTDDIKSAVKKYVKDRYDTDVEVKVIDVNKYLKTMVVYDDEYDIPILNLEEDKEYIKKLVIKAISDYTPTEDAKGNLSSHIEFTVEMNFRENYKSQVNVDVEIDGKDVIISRRGQSIKFENIIR